ncbi:insulinase family protein [Sphingosinicella sp. LY1275]|uniref:M16 family metallopeptidase n=1 Tax=Sphingosinicella sp. LY1275 TaxID=3095379 RepID=UPI002ADEF664|nr:insulinase family protein [Sphingosinicella sp. LY1275]MEA1014967.1 insulinase family protein [Sphingosinicella sp. LY1275]
MTFLRRCLLALLLLAAGPLHAAIGDGSWFYRGSDIPADPAWTFGTLPNGLRYAVRRNALPAGQVSIRVRIDAGSMHEADQERGWAHLVEHMAFRGTKGFADREARHIWQKLGASFGSDTNASTTPTQTVYQLDLPDADASEVDLSLRVISEMVDSALFDPAAVDAERKIVLAEKGRRPELANRFQEASWPLVYAGLRLGQRDPIGTEATLKAANAAGLRAFYQRWYRPDRATVIVVGDADPAELEKLIAKNFGGWQPSGPAPREPDYGSIAKVERRTAALVYPGAPHSASLTWLRPYVEHPNTRAREQADMARTLAARILNRRLEAKARGEAAYVSAFVGESRQTDVADMTQAAITAREGKWQEALAETFAIISDALRSPPSKAEIAREIQNMQTVASSAVTGETTVKSQQRAQQMVAAIDGNSVVATAATSFALLNEFAPQMTPEAVQAAMHELFSGEGPRMVQLSPTPIAEGAVETALATAEKTAPATRMADRIVTMDSLPKLGKPGKEVSRQQIADMGVTILRFANGSTLTFKQTDFEKGRVNVQLRFGEGLSGLPADRPVPHWFSSIVGPSGLADLDLDAMERLLTGRKMTLSFGIAEDAFVLRGVTNGNDLPDQLRLLATKLAKPRWDPALFARYKTGALESYDLAFASATARGGREFGGFARGGDARWMPAEKEQIAATSLAEVQALFDPLLAQGPVEAIIVGDVDLETAVNAMKKTIAALPVRPATSAPEASRRVQAPKPDPKPVTFTHQGDKDQAYALIGWTTFGGVDRTKERRALSLAAKMFGVRLFDELREVEGASYAPSATSVTAEEYPDWGIFYAASELRPESVDTFFRIARRIVADMAAKPAEADEFARAQNPTVSTLQRQLKTNAYWLSSLEAWPSDPQRIERIRTIVSDYAGLTAEDVRAALAKHVTEAGDWSMVVLPAKANGGGH